MMFGGSAIASAHVASGQRGNPRAIDLSGSGKHGQYFPIMNRLWNGEFEDGADGASGWGLYNNGPESATLEAVSQNVVIDAFNRADESPPTGWVTPTDVSPAIEDIDLIDNQIEGPSGGDFAVASWNTALSTTAHEIWATIKKIGSDLGYIGLSAQSSAPLTYQSNHVELEVGNYVDESGIARGWLDIWVLTVAPHPNPGWYRLGVAYTKPEPFEAEDEIRMNCHDSVATAFVNGVQVKSETIAPAFTAGTYVGVQFYEPEYSGGTRWAVDDVGAGPSAYRAVRGKKMAKVSWSVGNTSQKGIYPTHNPLWRPYQTYCVSFYAKLGASLPTPRQMGLYWNVAPAVTVILNNPDLTTEWQLYAWQIRMGASVENSGEIYISINGTTTGGNDLYFDAVNITHGADLQSYTARTYPTFEIAGPMADGSTGVKFANGNQYLGLDYYTLPVPFVIEAWIKAGKPSYEKVFFSNRNDPAQGWFTIGVQDDGKIHVWDNYGGGVGLTGNRDVCDGQWHQIVFMNLPGNVFWLFVDGVLDNSAFLTRAASSGYWRIGWDDGNPGIAGWHDTIKDVSIYTDSLTDAKLSRIKYLHYAASFGVRTNLLKQSEEINQSPWSVENLTVSADATSAPDGDNADKIVETTANGYHRLAQVLSTAVETGDPMTFSICVKAAGRSKFGLQITPGNEQYAWVDFNLANQTIANSYAYSGTVTGTIAPLGNDWYRCAISWDHITPQAIDCFVYIADDSFDYTYIGDVTKGLYVWGAHAEHVAAVGPYIPTGAAIVTTTDYDDEVVADSPAGFWRMDELTLADLDTWPLRPIGFAIDGVDRRDWLAESEEIEIDDTLGQQSTVRFTLVNPIIVPQIGEEIKFTFYDQVIFAGVLSSVAKTTDSLAAFYYQCEGVDWSAVLMKRRLRRKFDTITVQGVIASILQNELAEEQLSIGTIESRSVLPLVDADKARAIDVIRDLATATGQTFYVDYDRSIQLRSATVPSSPFAIDESIMRIDGTEKMTDQETYRNVQIVIVTGTPPNQSDTANVTVIERTNDNEIALRKAIEGGSGRYEEIEEITHPLSNVTGDLALLGIGYATLRLATSGQFRTTVRGRVDGYGFRAGQLAVIDLPTFAVSGTFVIQRVQIRNEGFTRLIHDLELTSSSRQQRAYESWLALVSKGKVTIQLPGSMTTNKVVYTSGTGTWTVPAGITSVTLTCIGASGGGGGYWRITIVQGYFHFYCVLGALGGRGGNSGKAISIIQVTEGDELSYSVGAAGGAGVDGSQGGGLPSACPGAVSTDGGTGGNSRVWRGGSTFCQGDGGHGGGRATGDIQNAYPGADGSPGSGIGDAVTVGGGVAGGGNNPMTAGADGSVTIEW